MNKVIKQALLMGLGVGSLCPAFGQQFYSVSEYGVAVGASHYFGDLNPNYGFKNIRPAVGLIYKYHINPYISVAAVLNGTQVGYKDSWSDNAFQQARNLSFNSYIIEAGVLGEFNFFWFETGNHERRFTPYVAFGVTGFYSNPYTELDGRKYNLKSIGTEGQNTAAYKDRKYSNINMAFPIGIGFKTWITPGLNLAVEFANRFTTTDYIDDVSQTYVGAQYFSNGANNNPSYRLQDRSPNHQLGVADQQRGDRVSFDQFFMAQIKLTFQLKTEKCPSYKNGLWEP